jgi:hypothetical protein
MTCGDGREKRTAKHGNNNDMTHDEDVSLRYLQDEITERKRGSVKYYMN